MRKASEPSQIPFEPEELDSENAKRILREVVEELHSKKTTWKEEEMVRRNVINL